MLATAEQLKRFQVLERRLVPGIELQGLLELRQGFIGFALSGECHAEVQMAERIIRPQPYHLSKLCPGFPGFSLKRQFNPQQITRLPKTGTQPDRLLQTCQRLDSFALRRQRVG